MPTATGTNILYNARSCGIPQILEKNNVPYLGPDEFIPYLQTVIAACDSPELNDGARIILSTVSTPANFYTLSYKGVTMESGSGDEMLQYLIDTMLLMRDGMLIIKTI